MSSENLEGGANAPSPGPAGRIDVFLSYKSTDHEIVEPIAEGLTARGLVPFLDRWDLEPGKRWRPELERVLESCGAVAVCLGPGGMGDVQKLEVDVALGRLSKDPSFPVIPVLLPEGEKPTGFLGQLTWVDLRHQSTEEGVDDLARAVRRGWTAPELRAKSRINRRRYLLNLLLLLVVILVGAAWYYRHLHSLAHVAVGGSITLVALARLLYVYLTWGAEAEVKDFSKRWLGHRRAAVFLTGALALVVGLFAFTSSIHLDLDASATPGAAYTVEVRRSEGPPLWTSPQLDAKRPAASKLFFFRLGLKPDLRLVNAEERDVLRVRMKPWTRLEVWVPGQFPPRQVSMIRLLPRERLQGFLAFPHGPSSTTYDLEVVLGGQTHRFADLRRQAVYIASNSNDFVFAHGQETEAVRRARFGAWIRSPNVAPTLQEDLVERWVRDPRVEILPDLASLEDAVFRLVKRGQADPIPLEPTLVDGTNQIRSLLIELKGR